MRSPDRLGPRLGRAFTLAGSGIALGSVAHLEAGAAAHLGMPALVGAVLMLALAWSATARRVPWPVVALVLGAGQAVTHGALTIGGGAQGLGGTHAHGSTVSLPAAPGADARMLALHVAAWILLTWAFTLGERALWRSVERILAGMPRVWLPLPHPRVAVAGPAALTSALAHRTVLGRAPPLP